MHVGRLRGRSFIGANNGAPFGSKVLFGKPCTDEGKTIKGVHRPPPDPRSRAITSWLSPPFVLPPHGTEV